MATPLTADCATQVIKRFIMHSKKTAFVVEHDFIMATYLADRVIVYEGQASKHAVARTPQSLQTGAQSLGCVWLHCALAADFANVCNLAWNGVSTGMNLFLANLDITFRRDPTNYRPRINKMASTKDREQKEAGTYYYIGDD
jgi:ATP-binding cassette subfamily E protein 1